MKNSELISHGKPPIGDSEPILDDSPEPKAESVSTEIGPLADIVREHGDPFDLLKLPRHSLRRVAAKSAGAYALFGTLATAKYIPLPGAGALLMAIDAARSAGGLDRFAVRQQAHRAEILDGQDAQMQLVEFVRDTDKGLSMVWRGALTDDGESCRKPLASDIEEVVALATAAKATAVVMPRDLAAISAAEHLGQSTTLDAWVANQKGNAKLAQHVPKIDIVSIPASCLPEWRLDDQANRQPIIPEDYIAEIAARNPQHPVVQAAMTGNTTKLEMALRACLERDLHDVTAARVTTGQYTSKRKQHLTGRIAGKQVEWLHNGLIDNTEPLERQLAKYDTAEISDMMKRAAGPHEAIKLAATLAYITLTSSGKDKRSHEIPYTPCMPPLHTDVLAAANKAERNENLYKAGKRAVIGMIAGQALVFSGVAVDVVHSVDKMIDTTFEHITPSLRPLSDLKIGSFNERPSMTPGTNWPVWRVHATDMNPEGFWIENVSTVFDPEKNRWEEEPNPRNSEISEYTLPLTINEKDPHLRVSRPLKLKKRSYYKMPIKIPVLQGTRLEAAFANVYNDHHKDPVQSVELNQAVYADGTQALLYTNSKRADTIVVSYFLKPIDSKSNPGISVLPLKPVTIRDDGRERPVKTAEILRVWQRKLGLAAVQSQNSATEQWKYIHQPPQVRQKFENEVAYSTAVAASPVANCLTANTAYILRNPANYGAAIGYFNTRTNNGVSYIMSRERHMAAIRNYGEVDDQTPSKLANPKSEERYFRESIKNRYTQADQTEGAAHEDSKIIKGAQAIAGLAAVSLLGNAGGFLLRSRALPFLRRRRIHRTPIRDIQNATQAILRMEYGNRNKTYRVDHTAPIRITHEEAIAKIEANITRGRTYKDSKRDISRAVVNMNVHLDPSTRKAMKRLLRYTQPSRRPKALDNQ